MPRLPLMLLALFAGAPAAAQDPPPAAPQEVQARVIGLEEGMVRIDVGSESGVAVGDDVEFQPRGLAPVQGIVRRVEARHALVEPLRVAPLPSGTRATVRASGEVPEAELPDHPGWEQPPEDWDENMPLLADPARQSARPSLWRTRTWFGYDRYEDLERDGRASSTARAGFSLDAWRILDGDDRLEVDFEYRRRTLERDGQPDDVDGAFRLDRLAYGKDATRERPETWRVGRFLQGGFAEFGVLDGVEWAHAPWSGVGYGASVGYRPQLYEDFNTFEDLQMSGHVRWRDREGVAELGAGYQRTWDDGAPDRDLLLLDASYRPRFGFHAYGTAWLDWYDSSDRVDGGTGLELTQAFVGSGWRSRGGDGVLVSYTHLAFPALTGDWGFIPPSVDPLDLRNDRLRFDGWLRLGERWRPAISAWVWDDESDQGGGGEVRLDVNRLGDGGVSLGAAVFADQGLYTETVGLRMDARWSTSLGLLSLNWTGRDLAPSTPGGGGTTEGFHQGLRAGLDTELGGGWSLSLWVRGDSGAEQDSVYGGFWLQRRT